MSKTIIEGVVIDKCDFCGGVWLDPGELKMIKNMIRKKNLARFAVGLAVGLSWFFINLFSLIR